MKKFLLLKHWLALICILLFFIAASTVANATIRYVNHDGICGGHSPCYTTIQAAVNASAPGDIIMVASGTYNENITVHVSLNLKGAQAGNDARTRSGSESSVTGGGTNFTINADHVTIDGFTLNGPVSSAAVVMPGGNTGETIKNNIINNSGTAVSFNTSNTMFLQNVVNNVFATATEGFQENTSPIHDITISNNKFGGANGDIYNADITIIEGNSNVTVSGNNSNGDGTLIALFKTNSAQITGNTVIGDGVSSAIYIGGSNSNVSVSGNTVSSAGSAVNVTNYANSIGPNSSVTITGNNLHNNLRGIRVGPTGVASANTVVAHMNSLTGNAEFGLTNQSSFNVDATCNWWGASNGPGPVGPGSGDKVSTGVTFSPWFLSPNGACGGGTPKKDCKQIVEQNKKDFDDQQKADKEAFNAQPHTPQQKKDFEDQQKADKKAFDEQNNADKKACDNAGANSNARIESSEVSINPKADNGFTPSEYKLSNFPNPFSTTTTIKYEVPVESIVSLKVYNLSGQAIATLVEGNKKAGSYSVEFNASRLAKGMYYCKFVATSAAGQTIKSQQLSVVK